MGVISDHKARAFGAAAARAFLKSDGTAGSGSSAAGPIQCDNVARLCARGFLSFRSTLSQWLFWPSGSTVV